MKAIVKSKPERGLWWEEVPMPVMDEHEVLIKVKKTSICGTDVHIYKWDEWAQKNVPTPMVVGHEFMGHVIAVGSRVKNIKVGQRVSGEGHITCGSCPLCLTGRTHLCPNTFGVGVHVPGCFAEYLVIPEVNVFVLPDDVEDELASIFDPFGNAVHTSLQVSLTAEDVLITGAGPIGIMAVAVAKKAGARNIFITDMNDYRLDLARKMGATCAVNISRESIQEAMVAHKIEHGFTVGMEMSGFAGGLNTLLECSQNGAHIALLGILPSDTNIDWDLVIFKMLTLQGIYGREIFKTWNQMTHLLQSGLDLKPIITHRYPAHEFEKGFEAMHSGKCGKVILSWD